MGIDLRYEQIREGFVKKFNLPILKQLLLISFFSSFLANIDGGGAFLIPLIFGAYIVYQFYEKRQRLKFVTYFFPFIFLIIFFTAGGSFLIHFNGESSISDTNILIKIFTGLCSAYVVLITIWLFFKGQLKSFQFLILTIMIPIPYFLGLQSMAERVEIFLFYFLFNTGLSLAISNYFLPLKIKSINE